MLRGLIKTAVANILAAAGTERLVKAISDIKQPPLVVGYHQVVREFRNDTRNGISSMQISCEMFERHLDWLGSRYEFVSLDQIAQNLEQNEPFSRPVAAITFDDGYRDLYLNAFPILKRKGIPAAVFVVTDIVNTISPPLHDRLYLLLVRSFERWSMPQVVFPERLQRLDIGLTRPKKVMRCVPDAFLTMRALFDNLRHSEIERLVASLESECVIERAALDKAQPLTWSMLAEMCANGFTIGSHTKSHALLTLESFARVSEELRGSKKILEDRLGVPVNHFAYPDGRFDLRVAKAVAFAGYRSAFTACREQIPEYSLLTIPRKVLWEHSCVDARGDFSPEIMDCQVHWMFDRLKLPARVRAAAANGTMDPWDSTEETTRFVRHVPED